jgi:hypothetical protein
LPEILGAILQQLHPDDGFYTYDDEPGVCCKHREDDAVSAGLTALTAAARVNRVWFSVAVPILWQRPLEEALDDAAIPDTARRAFYAKHIRVVEVTKCSPLWRALSQNPGTGSHSNFAAGLGGSDAGMPPSCGIANSLRLPRLASLRISVEMCLDYKAARIFRFQAPLLWLFGTGLQALSCHLTPGLIDRLDAMKVQLMQPNSSVASQVPNLGQPAQQRHMRLRRLDLDIKK